MEALVKTIAFPPETAALKRGEAIRIPKPPDFDKPGFVNFSFPIPAVKPGQSASRDYKIDILTNHIRAKRTK